MGVSFRFEIVKALPGGGIEPLSPNAKYFFVKAWALSDIFDRLEHWKVRPTPIETRFPWFTQAVDYERREPPSISDCHRPKDVLASLQSLERELQRNSHRYPNEWTFHIPQPDGSRKSVSEFNAHYRGKPCRLFGDGQGCWAVETGTPLAYPIHYELTALSDVPVRFDATGPEVTVGISHRSYLAVQGPLIQDVKTVCLQAMQQNALLLPRIG